MSRRNAARAGAGRGRARAAVPQAAETVNPDLLDLVRALAGRRILVLADLVADEFITTGAARVSREAPVLILQHVGSRIVPGGGANAAANIAALGGVPLVVGEVGDDDTGRELVRQLRALGADVSGILTCKRAITPRKTRILAGDRNVARQQVVRIDRIEPFTHDESFLRRVRTNVIRALARADGVLISDYGLGFIDPGWVRSLVLESSRRKHLKVAADSRYRLFDFADVDVATPSESEVEAALGRELGSDPSDLEAAGRETLSCLRAHALVMTRGSQGLVVLESDQPSVAVPAFGTDQVTDVTGAGDTVIATLSLALAAGASYVQAGRLANAAAGVKVSKMGTATVAADELCAVLVTAQQMARRRPPR